MEAESLPRAAEDLEVFLREHQAADFVKAVAKCQETKSDLLLSVKAFFREPDILYVALDYAASHGVTVQIVPASNTADGSAISYLAA